MFIPLWILAGLGLLYLAAGLWWCLAAFITSPPEGPRPTLLDYATCLFAWPWMMPRR